ncbi:MAG: glycosyltransferase family 1 protein, partial [Acidobacteria bacterium]
LLYWPSLARQLARADVVHVFSASYFSFLLAPLPAVLVAHALGKPVVLNYRSGEAPDHLARSSLARRVIKSCELNVVPSQFLARVFTTHGIPSTIVPNTVDVRRFDFRAREPLLPNLLSTRNLEPMYNVACTLRAFALVQAREVSATLTLVGGGSQDASLRQLAASLGLRNVRFCGRVPPSEIWKAYAAADVYVQTPDIDNMPSSVLEAFSSGTPVVSTNAGGVPAIVEDGVNGLLAATNDHRAVAAAVLRLLDRQDLASRLARNARAACEGYTWPVVRSRWLELYQNLRPGRDESSVAEAAVRHA